MLTKSNAAFRFTLQTLFQDRSCAYMWTFTFADLPDFAEGHQRWRRFLNWLKRHFKGTVYGVRVYELHERHGLHIHALFNRMLRVELIRPATQRYRFGRIHVKRVDLEGAYYLGKYLSKQERVPWLKGKRLWAAFGDFPHTRVKDIEVDSILSRAIKVCQAELEISQLPFALFQALKRHQTEDPVRLKLACTIARRGGAYADLIQVLKP